MLINSVSPTFKLPLLTQSFTRSPLYSNVTEALGSVPIVRLNRLHSVCEKHHLYLKLESCNPGGSIKEKNAVYLVNQAEKLGLLSPGGTIIESSSGNFGIGLAIVGATRGYKVKIVIDAKTSPTIRRLLTAYGAELVEVPLSERDANGSMQIARMQKAQELARNIPDSWYPCQHENPSNPMAHEISTAKEIEAAFEGGPDAIAIGVSTAGQIGGISRYFKENYPKTRIIAVDVAGSVIFGTPPHPYKMTGLGLSFVPPNFDPQQLDVAYSIDDQLAFSVCHAIAKREGMLLGGSTGAIVAAALADVQQFSQPQRVCIVNPDRGDRYLETIYNPQWLEEQNLNILSDDQLTSAIDHLVSVPLNIVRGSK